jgi:hypothetical protein
MAINYTNLFADIGELIKAIEDIESFMSTIDTQRTATITSFDNSSVTNLVGDVESVFDAIISSCESNIQSLLSIAEQRLRDSSTVTLELPGLTSSNITEVVLELVSDMLNNSETVDKSTVTITDNGVTSSNTNVGSIITTKKLPGNVRPGRQFIANRYLAGVDSELPLADNLIIECVSDSQVGSARGSETFNISGNIPSKTTPYQFADGGNQGTTRLTVGSGLLSFFNPITSNAPDGWTITTGTAGSEFDEDTGTPFSSYDSTLRFIAAAGNAELRYNIYSLLTPGEVCAFYYYYKSTGSGAGTITHTIVIDGSTILTAGTSVGATSWTLVSGVFTVPDNIGLDDGTTYLSMATTSVGVSTNVAGGGIVPMTYHAGIGFCVTDGEEAFLVDDYFSVDLANNNAGKFQRMFAQRFGTQLPSSGTPSISDPT